MYRNDGGLAFPGSRNEEIGSFQGAATFGDVHYPGMSLRDWFAGQALVAVLNQTVLNEMSGSTSKAVAFNCYLVADAMLAERSKGNY